MPMHHQKSNNNAYAQLAADLATALAQFSAAMVENTKADHAMVPSPANDNDPFQAGDASWPSDFMTLKEIQFELRLKEAQIVKLRRLWGFPAPRHRDGKYLFSRQQVERWVRDQPNPQNLAAPLRLRRKRWPRDARLA